MKIKLSPVRCTSKDNEIELEGKSTEHLGLMLSKVIKMPEQADFEISKDPKVTSDLSGVNHAHIASLTNNTGSSCSDCICSGTANSSIVVCSSRNF